MCIKCYTFVRRCNVVLNTLAPIITLNIFCFLTNTSDYVCDYESITFVAEKRCILNDVFSFKYYLLTL